MCESNEAMKLLFLSSSSRLYNLKLKRNVLYDNMTNKALNSL